MSRERAGQRTRREFTYEENPVKGCRNPLRLDFVLHVSPAAHYNRVTLTNSGQLPGAHLPLADEQLRRLIERFGAQAHRTLRRPSPDAVHDLRVAIRRAEQALAIFKNVLPRKAVKRVRKQLKSVLSCAGEVRDYDIAVKILLKIDKPGSSELRRDIRARRTTAERSLLSRLRRLSLRTRVSEWLADLQLAALRPESATEAQMIAASSLSRLARRFFEAGESAVSHDSGEKLHEFRIEAKKLRYTLELFVPMYGAEMEERIKKIKSVQSALGKMNDYRSVLAMATEARSGKKLRAALKRLERRQIRQFREIWAEEFPGAVAADWKRSLKAGWRDRIPRKPITSSTIPHSGTAAAQA